MSPGVLKEIGAAAGLPAQKNMPGSQELVKAEKKTHDMVLKTFRLLISDLCQQFKGGHPG